MSLRQRITDLGAGKVLLVLATSIALLNLLSWVGARTILHRSFDRLERQYALQNLDRAQNVLTAELEGLDRIAVDWAHWDDTYRFIADRNAAYVDSNLVPETLADLGLNAMVFLNGSGAPIFALGYDLTTGRPAPAPPTCSPCCGERPRSGPSPKPPAGWRGW